MNEPLPPLPDPDQQPPPFDQAQLPPQNPPPPTQSSRPRFWPMFGLGVLLNLGSFGLCFVVQNPLPFFVAGFGTFITLFFEGYRIIFVGFITTIGVALLISLIACGAMVATNH